jgi:hypothetical protein
MLTNRIGWLAKLFLPCFSKSRRSIVPCWYGWRRHSSGLAYQTPGSDACSNPLSTHAGIDDSLEDACDGQQMSGLERSLQIWLLPAPQKQTRWSTSRCVVGLHVSGGRPTRLGCAPSRWWVLGCRRVGATDGKRAVLMMSHRSLLARQLAGMVLLEALSRLVAMGHDWLCV